MKTELLSVQNLSKISGDNCVLHHVSLRLFRGENAFMVGPADSGKSLLARLIAGQTQPSGGRMELLGRPYAPLTPEVAYASGIFYITADTPLVQNLTVGENIGLTRPPFAAHFRYQRRLQRYVHMLCDEYGIQLDLQKKAANLPLIDKLLVQCARAILRSAKLLIFDSVLHLLSQSEVDLFFEKLRILNGRGISTLLLEPFVGNALAFGGRLMFFADGRILADRDAADYTPEQTASILETKPVTRISVSASSTGQGQTRALLLPNDDGYRSVAVDVGEILGVSCHSMELYQRYIHYLFNTGRLEMLNRAGERQLVRLITPQQLRTDCFPDLTLEENILLPALKKLSPSGVFTPSRQHKLFLSEFSSVIDLPASVLHRKLQTLGGRERETAVLYRTVLEDAPIILFAGLTDRPNPSLQRDLYNVAALAAQRRKSVVFFGKGYERLQDLFHRVLMLDRPEGSS